MPQSHFYALSPFFILASMMSVYNTFNSATRSATGLSPRSCSLRKSKLIECFSDLPIPA